MQMRARSQPPEAPNPWNEILPGLWMGGHHFVEEGYLVPAVVAAEFDAVFSLHRKAGHGPAPHVEHHVLEIPDGPLESGQIDAVRILSEIAAQSWLDGRKVLVRCRSGYNRSGLVVAQVLIGRGFTAEAAVGLIRERRSPHALHNQMFVDYLTTGLYLSAQLAALEPW